MKTSNSSLWNTVPESTVTFGNDRVSIEDICDVALGKANAELSGQNEFIGKINRGSAFLEKLLADEGAIYGVTTGYGDSCTVAVPALAVVLILLLGVAILSI